MAYYTTINAGLDAASSLGDGYTINLKWFKAYPTNIANKIAYNIYYSTIKENVFSEGIKFVSTDGSLEANIINLTPGQNYYFSVRPVEYDSTVLDLNISLPIAYDNLKIYPTSLLREDITAYDLIIPLVDVTDFPSSGLIKIGVELIRYLSVDTFNKNLVLTDFMQRGYNRSKITGHTVDGYDGYYYRDPAVSIFGLLESNEYDNIYRCQSRFEYPNYQYTQADGYHQVTKDILTSDLTASDEINSELPPYDYSGYHRTDPVLLLTGACVGSYIGGEMGCIDGYGNYNILRGMSLQEQNNQRQEILLSVTGKPAVLIKRMRTGITCSCYRPSSEYADDRCPYCFAEGTLVHAENGLIPIENIKIGDKVLSSDGKYYKVTETFKNRYEGKLLSISTATTTNPILATPDHPFLVMRGHHGDSNKCGPNSNCKEYIKRGDGRSQTLDITYTKSKKYHARVQVKNHERISLGCFKTKQQAIDAINNYKDEHCSPGHYLKFDEAKNIKKNNWLVNKWSTVVNDISHIEIPKQFVKNSNLGMDRLGSTIFELNEDFLWMAGLYLAEGSCSKRTINFALHKKEEEYYQKLLNIFNKYNFNVKKYYPKGSNGMIVSIHSTSLSKWFTLMFGRGCNNKKIPQEFINLPINKSMALLKGVYDGDGTKRENEIVQTSEILCLQLAEILHKNGKSPLITRINNKILTPKGNKRKIAYRINWEEESFNRINRKGRWNFESQLLSKVKSVEEINYSGYVYNLEVEGDHTYIVQNLLVHNCYGTKFVFGYEQYFNPKRSDGRILVRPGPAEDNLKMLDAGLESEFNVELWTLSTPTIKNRDVIVMFDVDGNEEFRYEVMSVTRNNTIVSLQGGQKLRVQRIRKTDPAYQIRIFRDTSMFPSKLNTTLGMAPSIPPHTHEIVINEKVGSISQINQTTSVMQGHNHPIVNGEVMTVLGHTHSIIL